MPRRTLIATAALAAGLLGPAAGAHAAPFTVTSLADSGSGTLRKAIADANASPAGPHTITFDVSAPGSPRIALATDLPALERPVTVTGSDGVVIDCGGRADSTGLTLDGPGQVVTGIGVEQCGEGIELFRGAQSARVEHTRLAGNTIGIVTVGGDENGTHVIAENEIVGNAAEGVHLGDNGSPRVAGNHIAGNTVGVVAATSDPAVVEGNEIVSNRGAGIDVQVSEIVVRGNFIGVRREGAPAGNEGAGIEVTFGEDTVIGGDTPAEWNVIAGNGFEGIRVFGSAGEAVPAGAAVLGNRIRDNGGAEECRTADACGLGIDLVEAVKGGDPIYGVTAGRPERAKGQIATPFPVLTAAAGSRVKATLAGTGSGTQRVEVFVVDGGCDASGHGEGGTPVGTATVTLDHQGEGTLDVSLPTALTPGQEITAIATERGRSSEFARCLKVTDGEVDPEPSPTVTATPEPTATATASPTPAPTATATPQTTPAPTPTPEKSGAELILSCDKSRIVLVDVVPVGGGKVRLTGAAEPKAFAGRSLDVKLDGRSVASVRVGADGTFQGSVPAPSKARFSRARYQVTSGVDVSKQVKADRRALVDSIAVVAGKVVIRGRITAPFASRPEPIVFRRQTSCTTYEDVASVRPDRRGRFVARLPLPPAGAKAAVYRGQTRVALRKGGKATEPTFTLARSVDIR